MNWISTKFRNIGVRLSSAPGHFWSHKREIAIYAIGAFCWSLFCLFVLSNPTLNSFAHEDPSSKLFPLFFLSSSFVVGLVFRGWIRNLNGFNAVVGAGFIAFVNAWILFCMIPPWDKGYVGGLWLLPIGSLAIMAFISILAPFVPLAIFVLAIVSMAVMKQIDRAAVRWGAHA